MKELKNLCRSSRPEVLGTKGVLRPLVAVLAYKTALLAAPEQCIYPIDPKMKKDV